jgi:hypothetical protein
MDKDFFPFTSLPFGTPYYMHGYHQTPCGVRIDGGKKGDCHDGEKGGGTFHNFSQLHLLPKILSVLLNAAETKFLNS